MSEKKLKDLIKSQTYSKLVVLVVEVSQTGDLLMDGLQEAVLYARHNLGDFISAFSVFSVIFCTPKTQISRQVRTKQWSLLTFTKNFECTHTDCPCNFNMENCYMIGIRVQFGGLK